MTERVVEGPVLPAAPEHADPGASEDADRVRMIAATGAGATVDVRGPGRGVARVVSEDGQSLPQALVARPAEADPAVLAGGVRDRGDAGLGRELFFEGEAGAVVAQLHEDLGGVDASGAREGHDDRAVRVLGHGVLDRGGESLDLGDEGLEHYAQGLHQFPFGVAFRLASHPLGGTAEAREQFGGRAPAAQ